MDGEVDQIMATAFKIPENEGEDKVVSLTQAIEQNVKPGMKLYIGEGANAAICELLRQYQGQRPNFTLITPVVTDHALNLLHCGLVNKIITTNCAHIYPTLSPSPVIQNLYRKKEIEIENWTLYSIQQRLMAGALGVGFMPTKSIIGTSMSRDNEDCFKVIDDPFGSGQKIGLVKALNPDMAIVHGFAADRYGDTIPTVKYASGDSIWGAMAARGGTIVTVEKVVSTDFIRWHSSFVKVPGYVVNSVSLVPFGAHPQGITFPGIEEELESYDDDRDFSAQLYKVSKDPTALDAWIKEWVLDCPTHNDYLRKLGLQRLLYLKGKRDKDAWEYQFKSLRGEICENKEINPIETMVVAAARKIKERVLKNGYKAILAGIGVSGLAAWLAYYQLKKENYDVELVTGSGLLGYAPRPGDPSLLTLSNMPTCKITADVLNAYGLWVAGESSKCLSVLSAAQVDKYGNINSTQIPGELYFSGSGGANDASNAKEIVIIVRQSGERFLESLPYITCCGEKAKTLISSMGIFEKLTDSEFILTHYFPSSKPKQERIREIKENCGWELKVSPEITEITPLSKEELITLRMLDPKGTFIGR
jgi:acyl CoA:acetate/3-ketoacid CoA transferase alpha subunit/acyl CoA:acetate/3-ketoacid CoA transferase beta subunit